VGVTRLLVSENQKGDTKNCVLSEMIFNRHIGFHVLFLSRNQILDYVEDIYIYIERDR
jgi:ABC-type histidine transport system ATPase subunit